MEYSILYFTFTLYLITKTLKNNKMKKETRVVIKENTWLTRDFSDHGWGNGYVIIPKGHSLHGLSYYEIEEEMPSLSVNGGLTFSEDADKLIGSWDELSKEDAGCYVVGFDTCHPWNTLLRWPENKVLEEAQNLKEQIDDLETRRTK